MYVHGKVIRALGFPKGTGSNSAAFKYLYFLFLYQVIGIIFFDL